MLGEKEQLGQQFNFRQVKFEMPIQCPLVAGIQGRKLDWSHQPLDGP